MTFKPAPKYGWHGQSDHDDIAIGDRVFHTFEPAHFGTVIDGPKKPDFGDVLCWLIEWDKYKGIFFHTCNTIRKQLPET